jgi:hypothetical protein
MMAPAPVVFLAVLAADGLGASAADVQDARPRSTELSASATSGTPAVLPGLAIGAAVEAQRQLGRGPLFVAARLQWSDATGANDAWIFDHNQFLLAGAAGASTTLGVARLWAEAGAGAQGLYETLTNHQGMRATAAGVPGASQSSFTVGAAGFVDVGVALLLRDPVRGFVAGGPTLARTTLDGGSVWRFGGQARVGVAYDF